MKAWKDFATIGIVGVGTIGGSWSALFLAKGYRVVAFDPAPGAEAAARALIEGSWPALRKLENAPETIPWDALSFVPTAAEAARGADFVQ